MLFNFRVTHSFILYAFACYVDKPSVSLEYYLLIATPKSDNMIIDQVYKSYMLRFGDREFLVDLLALKMYDFKVILRVKWLATYHASIDYYIKELVFDVPGKFEFCFRGKNISSGISISFVKAKKIMTKGCDALLASVIVDQNHEICLQYIFVVWEFLDVPPEDLPGIPPDREIEFMIYFFLALHLFLRHLIEWYQSS